MARSSTRAAASSTSSASSVRAADSARSPAGAEPAAVNGSAEPAKVFMTNSLVAASAVVNWFTQMQQLQAQGLADLGQALESALHESEHAADPQALLAVGSELVNRQLALAIRQLGAALTQWIESDLKIAGLMGQEVAALAQQTLPGSVHAQPSSGNPLTAMKDLGRLQDQWLAMTQQWLDAAGARAAR